jgi:flagellar FliL protein
MSAAAADPALADSGAPAKGGKKKLMMILVLLLVVVLAGGGGALFLLKKKAHAGEDGAEEEVATAAHKPGAKADPAHPPTFLPLDPFVVNLADRDADRYAQIGIVLEVDSPIFADQMKAYMPAIRNAILMILAHKTSRELLERAGKEELAEEILRETVRPMGIEIEAPEPKPAKAVAKEAAKDGDDEAEGEPEPKPRPKRARKPSGEHNPVRHVHFSSFIIQ